MDANTELRINEIVNRLDIASHDREALSKDIGQLFDRTNKLDDEGDVIAAGVDALHTRVSALEVASEPKSHEPPPIMAQDPCGILRYTANGVVVDLSTDSYEDRRQEQMDAAAREDKEIRRRMTDGLPSGYFRDPCGIVRSADGRTAAIAQREQENARAVGVQGPGYEK
jgi:hypothetical protein